MSPKHLSILTLISNLGINACILQNVIVLVPGLIIPDKKSVGFIKGIIFYPLPSGRHKFFFFFTSGRKKKKRRCPSSHPLKKKN
jgi:hypothetical protein